MADATRLPQGIIVEGSLLVVRPVDTIIRDSVTGDLFASTDSAVATYIPLTGATAISGVIIVAKSGGQFSTIAGGLALANSGDVVLVYPGTYAENVIIPAGVVLQGATAQVPIIISGADTTGTRVTLTGGGAPPALRHLTVIGPSAGANPAIDATGLGVGSGVGALFDVLLQGGGGTATGAGILGVGTGTLVVKGLLVLNAATFGGPLIDVQTGGTVFLQVTTLINGGASDIVRLAGTASIEIINLLVSADWTSVDGFEIGGTARLEGSAVEMAEGGGITNALHVTADGVSIELEAVDLVGSTFDILIDPALVGTGTSIEYMGLLVEARVSAPATYFDTATAVMFSGDTIEGKWTTRGEALITEKLDVGQPGPARAGGLDVGEGGSYQTARTGASIVAFTYDASAASGSRFTSLDINANNTLLADIGDRIYVGVPDIFWGVRFDIGVASSAEGPWVARYWDGSALVSTSWGAINKASAVRLGDVLMQAIETEYGVWDRDVTLDWATADNQLDTIPNTGTALFWIAFQATATLGTPPRIDEIKVRGSDFDIVSGDPPHAVFWGRTRTTRTAHIDAAVLKRQGANTPTLVDVPIAVGVISEAQRFGQNDRLPLSWEIPEDCDTSCVVRVSITYTSDGVTTITLAIAYLIVADGAAISGATGVTDTITRTVTPTGADVVDIDVELTEALSGAGSRVDLTAFTPGDRIFFDILRTDGNAGTFDLFFLDIIYVRWEHGEVT